MDKRQKATQWYHPMNASITYKYQSGKNENIERKGVIVHVKRKNLRGNVIIIHYSSPITYVTRTLGHFVRSSDDTFTRRSRPQIYAINL